MREAMRPGYSSVSFRETMETDWAALQRKIAPPMAESPSKHSLPFWVKIAATVFIVMSFAIGSWYATKESVDGGHIASADTLRHVVLEDGTRVWLNRHSTLTVPATFNGANRAVRLEGEAYFEVARDVERPFIISTGEVDTRVLGTEFQVTQKNDGSVTVTVAEGKVAVTSNSASVTLVAHEVAHYDAASKQLDKSDNEDANYSSWRTGVLRFRNARLDRVCSSLERHYHTRIELTHPDLADKKVTTVMDKVSLEDAISILTATLELSAEKRDSVIFLSR